MLAIKSFVNFSEEAKTTLSCFLEPISSFAIECKRWVFPKPTQPYIISGLKSEDPGVFATLCAAFFAKTLFGPSIKVEKTFAGLILLLFPALLVRVQPGSLEVLGLSRQQVKYWKTADLLAI